MVKPQAGICAAEGRVMMKNEPKFRLGQRVYPMLGGDAVGMVTGITHRPDHFVYLVSWRDGREEPHYDVELTETKARDFAD